MVHLEASELPGSRLEVWALPLLVRPKLWGWSPKRPLGVRVSTLHHHAAPQEAPVRNVPAVEVPQRLPWLQLPLLPSMDSQLSMQRLLDLALVPPKGLLSVAREALMVIGGSVLACNSCGLGQKE